MDLVQRVRTHGASFQWCAVSTIGQKSGIFGEFWETSDSKVFLIRVCRSNDALSLE